MALCVIQILLKYQRKLKAALVIKTFVSMGLRGLSCNVWLPDYRQLCFDKYRIHLLCRQNQRSYG